MLSVCPPAKKLMNEIANPSLAGKQILLIGGCGSIGSKIISKLLDTEVETIRVFDTDEEALFALKQGHTDSRLRFLLGDIRDRDRLERRLRMSMWYSTPRR